MGLMRIRRCIVRTRRGKKEVIRGPVLIRCFRMGGWVAGRGLVGVRIMFVMFEEK